MPFYLSEYIGTGTRLDPFRPVGSDQPGWSAIDLRPDPSVVDGGGLNACLLHTPVGFTDALARFLADDKLEPLTNPQKNFLENKLGVDLSSPTLLRDIIATILTSPPSNRWKALTPGRLRWEIWLGGLLWEAPRASGGASDNFNRANETPLASPWVNSGTNGDISSAANLSGNVVVSPSGYALSYYAGAATSADQYSEALAGGRDAGVLVRAAAGASAFNAYFFQTFNGTAEVLKVSNGTFSNISGGTGSTGLSNTARTLRVEIEGSSLTAFINGVEEANVITDTSWTNGQPGVAMVSGVHTADNFDGGDLTPPEPVPTFNLLPPLFV